MYSTDSKKNINMKTTVALLLLSSLCVYSTIYNLDQDSTVTLSCKDSTWLTISSNPSSGYLWYAPSTDFLIQEDSLGYYQKGSQYFNILCSDKATKESTYGINFYYVDSSYSLIYTYQVSVYITSS